MTERDKKLKATKGYLESGLPYFRVGSSPRILVIFAGLSFENKPPSGLMLRMSASGYKRIAKEYMVFSVGPKTRSTPWLLNKRHV